jgi:5-methylcytosine-specific restriction enzyme subunit McrC
VSKAPTSAFQTKPVLLTQEWKTKVIPGQLSERDRTLAGRLRAERKVFIEELRSGIRVESKSWVGVINLDGLSIRIVPKLAGDALGVADMLAFTKGTEALKRSLGRQPIEIAPKATLLELLAQLLAESTELLVRGGLVPGYVQHEQILPALRGRMRVREQVLQGYGQAHPVYCRFDELEYDTIENRLLAVALAITARSINQPKLHRRLRYLGALFAEVCTPEELDIDLARAEIVYDRQNSHYRDAHTLAWLILDGFGVHDVLPDKAETKSFAFLLDMNVLFEDFVTVLLRRLFPTPIFRVQAQARNYSVLWNVDRNRSYGSVRPDVVISHGARALAVDAKYKEYDSGSVANSDIYQALLYAHAYAPSSGGSVPTALIAYPSTDVYRTEVIRLRRPGDQRAAELVVIGLPVRKTVQMLEASSSPAKLLRETILPLLSPLKDIADFDVGGHQNHVSL